MNKMSAQTAEANRRAAWRWGGFVVGLLGLQIAGGIFAIMLATGDKSVAVVPDYHQKALQWDRQVALQEASQRLGWTLGVEVTNSGRQHPGMSLLLVDRTGMPVVLDQGEIQIYRHVRASEVRTVALPNGTTGAIKLTDCFTSPGLWQVSVDVTDRQGNRFADSREINVELAK